MTLILFDTPGRKLLYPFTSTHAIADIRTGIFTIKERWEKLTGQQVYILTEPYLQTKYPAIPSGKKVFVNASVIGEQSVVSQIMNLRADEALVKDGEVIAGVSSTADEWDFGAIIAEKFKTRIPCTLELKRIKYPWDIFLLNRDMLHHDFKWVKENHKQQPVVAPYGWVAPENIFIEDGAILSHCFINASGGPVYLASDTVIMEGCMIRGPFAMGRGSTLKMGTRIYGATTIGPCCTVGGEIKNAVIMGYSNKAHDGYLGDSVIGEWCNLGAGTSNSNVRNDAGMVYMNKGQSDRVAIGLKCGLFMGDYSRSAINTSFNTGTFAGVSANIFGQGFAPKYLPDFTWGFSQRYIFEKAIEHIANWKKLKAHDLTPTDIHILEHLYKQIML